MTTDNSGSRSDVILRHPRERKSKCSLEPLKNRRDLVFHTVKPGFRFDATGFILLELDGDPFAEGDRDRPLLILDSTWRLLPQLRVCLYGDPLRRRLPTGLRTAYPRVSKIGADPFGGLASVEALYAARRLQGREDESLLEGYYWREEFLWNWSGEKK